MKAFVLFILLCFYNFQAYPQNEAKEAVTFIYHRFEDNRYPSTSTSSKNFEAHLKYLIDNNYRLLTFSEAIQYVQSDEPHSKVAVISIDDGYKSFYDKAFPILRKYKITATLFVTTETVGGKDFMSWDQLKELKEFGIEIGNHSQSHPYFLNNNESTRYSTLRKEIIESQTTFLNQINFEPKVIAYPYGEFDIEMMNIVKDLGFIAAAAQNSGVINSNTNFFKCPRFPMSDTYANLEDFKIKARTSALTPTKEEPNDFVLPASSFKPKLKLEFETKNLKWSNAQCFVQGSKCELTQKMLSNNKVSITMSATSPLTNRRTLYTLTVQDPTGQWHWYSHLWIKPEIK